MTTIGICSNDFHIVDGQPRWGGAGWARLGQYVDGLKARWNNVVVSDQVGKHSSGTIVVRDGDSWVEPNILILQRTMNAGLADNIKTAVALGQIVISDLDDWFWGLDTRNSAFEGSHPSTNPNFNRQHYWKVLGASSCVTVSTPYLLNRLVESKLSSRAGLLLPNYVDVSRFGQPRWQEEMPTFGWAGSTLHRSGDVETLTGLFKRFLDAGELKLHHSGHLEGAPTFASQAGLDENLVSTSPRVNVEDWPSALDHFDVGLVPLRYSPFNEAKSDIKGLEYAAKGIPFIAAATSSYRSLYDEFGGGFILAKRPQDWIKGINRLLDLDVRLEMQNHLLTAVRSRDLSEGLSRWVMLLERLLGTQYWSSDWKLTR